MHIVYKDSVEGGNAMSVNIIMAVFGVVVLVVVVVAVVQMVQKNKSQK